MFVVEGKPFKSMLFFLLHYIDQLCCVADMAVSGSFVYVLLAAHNLHRSEWPSGLRRQTQGIPSDYQVGLSVLVHECGRGFEPHF